MDSRHAQLTGAHRLMRGQSWPAFLLPAFTCGTLALLLGQGLGTPGGRLVGSLVLAVIGVGGFAVQWTWFSGFAVWDTGRELVIRRRRRRWVRIPWSDVRGMAWVRCGRISGPAVTTTGGRYDRPNPDWMTILGQPMLPVGDGTAPAEALRAAAARHGVPWHESVPEEQVENKWTSTRWDW